MDSRVSSLRNANERAVVGGARTAATLERVAGTEFHTHRRLPPSPALAQYVRCYEYTESMAADVRAYPFAVSVFPLLCFHLRERCRVFEYAPGQTRVLPRAIAVGPCDHRVADVLHVGHLMHFSVVFQPTGFFRLFRISPWEVRNCAYDCTDVLGEHSARLHTRLCEAASPKPMVRAVEELLLEHCERAAPRSGIHSAAEALLHSKGRADLFTLADSLGLSDSSWRRHFSNEIGATPKRYSRMLRFRHAIALKRIFAERSWTQVCLEAGYYDQAHFIADCQALVGSAPSSFMRELATVPETIGAMLYGPVAAVPTNRRGSVGRMPRNAATPRSERPVRRRDLQPTHLHENL